jgi:DNA-binding response OmpR family regulator
VPDRGVILLVEDREDDVLLVTRAFEKANFQNPMHVVRDGEEAVAYLKGEGKYAHRAEYPLPDLMLLDLKMPRMNGFDVLRWLRTQSGLSSIRVIVLTSCEDIRDVNLAYKLGANSFLVKPLDFEHFVETSKVLRNYWLWLDKGPEAFRPPKEAKSRLGRKN